MRAAAGKWWRAWRDRFGLAELVGTIGAIIGFEVGYGQSGRLLVAAGLATTCEVVGFYTCIALRTGLEVRRVTRGLTGWQRFADAARHAVLTSLASCVTAELADLLIRPGFLAGTARLFRGSTASMWIGYAVGKLAADAAWYGVEASARRGYDPIQAAVICENPE
ncbi:MAG: hypothetical protein ACR2FU_07520 [Streptosporangiaceae bacterium]